MSDCNGKCGDCGSKGNCGIAKLSAPEGSRIKRVIGVVSGKGGVGKSLTTASLAALTARAGYSVGIIDGDITGASQPRIFGLHGNLSGDGDMIYPAITLSGIKLVSINLMLDSPETPVVWRGSMVSNCLKQFWNNVAWEDIDYMFIDMPPGTGDVPLTVFQSFPLDGIVIVTTPQDLVSMIVKKACKMAGMMNVPIIGLVENMSFMQCECGKKVYPFGVSKIDAVAKELDLPVLAQVPIDPIFAESCDAGKLEEQQLSVYDNAVQYILDKYPLS